jgi:hypothetical protein
MTSMLLFTLVTITQSGKVYSACLACNQPCSYDFTVGVEAFRITLAVSASMTEYNHVLRVLLMLLSGTEPSPSLKDHLEATHLVSFKISDKTFV